MASFLARAGRSMTANAARQNLFRQQVRCLHKVSTGEAVWKGTLQEGSGSLSGHTGALSGIAYDFPNRFAESTQRTNPEELIGASISSCFSMFLSSVLSKQGLNPDSVKTTAAVTLEDGPKLTKIEMVNETKCAGLSQADFDAAVKTSKEGCPIANALAGVPEISVTAKLLD